MEFVLVLFTVICVVLLDRSESIAIKKVLNWIPAILFAYIIPAIITHAFSLDLSGVSLHGWSKSFIMPMAIVLVMSALSFKQLKQVGIRPIMVFLSGSAGVALMPFIILFLLSFISEDYHTQIIDAEYWKGMVTLVGSWIGGSTSQLVLKEVSGCNEQIFLVILVMDNVFINLWTILMFQKIKRSEAINRALGINDPFLDVIPDQVEINNGGMKGAILTLSICLGVVILCSILISSFLLKIVVLSVFGLIVGNALRFWNHSLVIKTGGYFIILIMAILGLKLNFSNFGLPVEVIIFCAIWLLSHYVIMMTFAYFMKLNMAWVPIASMANVGGISTAPAVTKAYNEEWMPHAILLAILSMVSGTYWGLLTIYLFQQLY